VDFQITKYVKSRTDEELLNGMKKVAEANEGTLTQQIYNNYRKTIDPTIAEATTICRQIGWNKALELIGVQPNKYQSNSKISEVQLLEEVLRLWIELGRQPTTTDLKNGYSKYPRNRFSSAFGSLGETLNRFIKWTTSEEFSPTAISTLEYKNSERNTTRDVNLRLRFKVMQHDNFKCRVCGNSPANNSSIRLHIDHIIPWAKGGETVLENLQTLCQDCNLGKSDLSI